MTKPIESYIFHPINGVWTDVLGKEHLILADVLMSYDILVDDRTQFMRLYDYDRGIIIWYKSHAMVVEITIFNMDRHDH